MDMDFYVQANIAIYLDQMIYMYLIHKLKDLGLRTGHLVSGQVRPPKDNERFFALLRVEKINNIDPNKIET